VQEFSEDETESETGGGWSLQQIGEPDPWL
jgi:hypothetical protein